jgi:Ca2+-binding RTX toxin-like protein
MASIVGTSEGDVLLGTLEDDVIEGLEGRDLLWGGDGGIDFLSGDAGDDVLLGDVGGDTLRGGDGNDHLFGGQGRDTLTDGAGNDVMEGGAEDDTLIAVGLGSDKIHGGEGTSDRLQVETPLESEFAISSIGDNFLFERTDLEQVQLEVDGIEILSVSPGGGKLTIVENLPSDTSLRFITFFGGEDNNTLDAHRLANPAVRVLAVGGPGNDTLVCGNGQDVLRGGDGNDTLHGGDGSDRLDGGAEDDGLLGGPGGDFFNYNPGEGNDSIFDFEVGRDQLFFNADESSIDTFNDDIINGLDEPVQAADSVGLVGIAFGGNVLKVQIGLAVAQDIFFRSGSRDPAPPPPESPPPEPEAELLGITSNTDAFV